MATVSCTLKDLSRFWRKVRLSDGCWEWAAQIDTGGYGMFWWNGKVQRAHRVSYELAGGTLIEGLVIDHTCSNRACVNPDHLEQVTQQENMSRMVTNSVRGMKLVKGPTGSDGLTICGTPGSYRRGCRCETCRAQQASRVKDYRRRKAAA